MTLPKVFINSGQSPAKRTSPDEPSDDTQKAKKQTSLLSHFSKISKARTERAPEAVGSSPVKAEVSSKNASANANANANPFPLHPTSTASTIASGTVSSDASQELTDPAALSSSTPPSLEMKLSVDEERLLVLELSEIPQVWLRHLSSEIKKPYFIRLKEFLLQEKSKACKIFPPEPQIYSWAKLCPFESVRVVVIGQDPYHNDGQAMGLCFSVPRGTVPPPSLINIYKELSQDIPGFVSPRHGDLSYWAQQGVLLLNTSLTVRAHEPASHSGKGWEQFTDAVIKSVNQQRKNVVFILWGNHAQKKTPMIATDRHCVLKGVHPSPLSAARGFFGCKHFSKTNQYLISKGLPPIDWQLPM